MKQSSTSSGCGEMAEIYFPINEGKVWNYHIALTQEGSTATSAAIITSLPSRELLGRVVATQHTEWFGQRQLRFIIQDDTGIYEWANQPDGAPEPIIRETTNYFLKNRAKVGTTWASVWQTSQFGRQITFPTTKIVESTDEVVTVPAGTFKRCVKIAITGRTEVNVPTGIVTLDGESFEWYAPNVGYVKGTFRESANAPGQPRETNMELTEFHG
jgi:uncharacterized protein DUF3108